MAKASDNNDKSTRAKKKSVTEVLRDEKKKKAFALYFEDGLTFEQIGKQIGVGTKTAHRYVNELSDILAADVSEEGIVWIGRRRLKMLDEVVESLHDRVCAGNAEMGDVVAYDRAIKNEIKLLGLDAVIQAHAKKRGSGKSVGDWFNFRDKVKK